MRRVVLDTNVLVSALITSAGVSRTVVDAWLDGQFELIVSPQLLAELRGVLLRPKFRQWTGLDEVDAFVREIEARSIVIDDPPSGDVLTPDPKDDFIVALARAAGVDAIVSGDAHLLDLPAPSPPVLTPRAFLEGLP